MKLNKRTIFAASSALALGIGLLFPTSAEAHCDTPDGPVAAALEQALAEDNFSYIASWVLEEDEAELLEVYELSTSVMETTDSEDTVHLAERYLLENLVRIHRAGEGAPYTGISNGPIAPEIAAADASIEEGILAPLEAAGLITDENRAHAEEVFAQVLATKEYDHDDVAAGRAFVENYVVFTHLFEVGHDEEHGDEHAEEQAEEHEESETSHD